MAERAAHLVDRVLPDVPVRQWVLTFPHRLRYVLAWRHDLCRVMVRLLHRAIERHMRGWARRHGLRDARGGGVAVIQRFGGSVNLNVHVLRWCWTACSPAARRGASRFMRRPRLGHRRRRDPGDHRGRGAPAPVA